MYKLKTNRISVQYALFKMKSLAKYILFTIILNNNLIKLKKVCM